MLRAGPLLRPVRSERKELLDELAGGVSRADLHANLRDIRLANRLFGGVGPMVAAVDRICPPGQPCTLLDVATGSADIPLALIRAAERDGRDLSVVATDLEPEILAVAAAAERPGRLQVERADARDLPYSDDAFDIATLSLALHHFGPEEAARVLSEMRRVARRAVLVSDLTRSWSSFAGAWIFAHALTRNRLTRHDAPLSVRRAYTPAEARELAHRAGWRAVRVKSVIPFRYLLVGRP